MAPNRGGRRKNTKSARPRSRHFASVFVNQIIGIDYDTGRAMREQLRQSKQQDRDALRQKAEDLGRAFIGVRDQAGYDRALATIAQAGTDTSAFSKQFDPAAVEEHVRNAMTWSQLIASRRQPARRSTIRRSGRRCGRLRRRRPCGGDEV